MGRPDAIQFNDFKPPDTRKMTFEHTFYLELENMNFVHMNKKIKPPNVTLADADVPTTFFQSPPFYNFPWWFRGWYMSPNEFAWLRKNSNFAKITNTTWQANVVGVRLPFTTNNDQSSIANSQVDQQFDLFKGMEKFMPFYCSENKANSSTELNFWGRGSQEDFITDLWGPQYATATNDNIPPTQGYRKFHIRPYIGKTDYWPGTKNFDCHTWPDYGQKKYATMDLKTFRGPVIQIDYTPKNGIIHTSGSIVNKRMFPDVIDRGSLVSLIYQPSVYFSREIDANFPNQGNPDTLPTPLPAPVANYALDFLFWARIYNANGSPRYTLGQSVLDGVDTDKLYFTDIEGPAHSTRHPPSFPNYQSLWMGVRPQMNGADYQHGITQIEIRTCIEVEYQVYMPLPGSVDCIGYNSGDAPNKLYQNNAQLYNDLDDIILEPSYLVPHYGPKGKLLRNEFAQHEALTTNVYTN